MASKNSTVQTVSADITMDVTVTLALDTPNYIYKEGTSAHLRVTPISAERRLDVVYVLASGEDAPADKQNASISAFKTALRKAVNNGENVVSELSPPNRSTRGRKGDPNRGIVVSW